MIPFSGNPLDRASEKRTDSEWLAAQRRDPQSMILPMWRLQPFLFGPERGPGALEAGFVRGGVDSLITQGIGVATGLQSKFDWVGVAAAGIGAD